MDPQTEAMSRDAATTAYYAWLDDDEAFHEDLHDAFLAGWEARQATSPTHADMDNMMAEVGKQERRTSEAESRVTELEAERAKVGDQLADVIARDRVRIASLEAEHDRTERTESMLSTVEEVANKLRTIRMLVQMGKYSMVEWSVLDHSIEQLDALVEEQAEQNDS